MVSWAASTDITSHSLEIHSFRHSSQWPLNFWKFQCLYYFKSDTSLRTHCFHSRKAWFTSPAFWGCVFMAYLGPGSSITCFSSLLLMASLPFVLIEYFPHTWTHKRYCPNFSVRSQLPGIFSYFQLPLQGFDVKIKYVNIPTIFMFSSHLLSSFSILKWRIPFNSYFCDEQSSNFCSLLVHRESFLWPLTALAFSFAI